ncbi:MAG: hypothetical protein BWY31_00130 [Lentisphaerae bacterium ADurb.Bin242]|nr:MAG: hypothetical protein BWY31_00130 [Lentisphaerae bacterium ADurb.Bin242]
MTEREFLERLRSGLNHLEPEELKSTLDFYREAIADRMEEGFSEAEAVNNLGDVEAIAASLRKSPSTLFAGNRKIPCNIHTGACSVWLIMGVIIPVVLILVGGILFSVALTAGIVLLLMILVAVIAPLGVFMAWIFRRRIGFCRIENGCAGVPVQKTFDAAIPAIDFADANAHVELSASPDDKIHLKYREFAVNGYTIGEADGILYIKGKNNRTLNAPGKFEIMVPSGFHGSLGICAENGKVSGGAVTGLGSVEVKLANGKMDLADLNTAGSLTVRTANGKVALYKIHCAGDMSITGSNGRIDLTETCADGRLEVIFKNIRLGVDRISAGKSIRLRANVGLIAGTLAGCAAAYEAPAQIVSSGEWSTSEKHLEIGLDVGKINLEFEG